MIKKIIAFFTLFSFSSTTVFAASSSTVKQYMVNQINNSGNSIYQNTQINRGVKLDPREFPTVDSISPGKEDTTNTSKDKYQQSVNSSNNSKNTTPVNIDPNKLPDGYKNTNITDLFKSKFGNADEKQLQVPNNLPSSDYINNKLSGVKTEQQALNTARLRDNALMYKLMNQSLPANPFGVDLDQKLSLFQSRLFTSDQMKDYLSNAAKPDKWGTAKNVVDYSLFTTPGSTTLSNQIDNYFNQIWGNTDINGVVNNANSKIKNQNGTSNAATQGVNGSIGSYVNPMNSGGYIENKIASYNQLQALKKKQKSGTLTKDEKSELNSLNNQFSKQGVIDDIGKYLKSLLH